MHRTAPKKTLMAVAVATVIGITDIAYAQMLEEVVVTARKRTESLQDVPMAVSAFGTQQLQDAQVDNITDLERMTPNVTLTETGGLQAGSVAVFVRGIGNDPGFDQGVGIYVDDVYMNRATGSLLEVYDVERIEVLKGPQGNLYGRNTIGGAIKYISREPTDELIGDVELRVGEFDMMQVKANIAGPIIGDTLMGSFGAMLRERDGIQTNTFDGGEYWDNDVAAYRGSLKWNITDSFSAKLSADYNKDKSSPRIPNRTGVDNELLEQLTFFGFGANLFLAPGTGVLPTPNDTGLPSDPDQVSSEYVDGFRKFEIKGTTVALTLNWDINDRWAVKSITAQRDVDHGQPFDFDGSEQQFITTINLRESTDFSQEFQFNYESESFKAVMGLYYLDGEQKSPGETYQYPRLLGTMTQFKDTHKDTRELESQSAYASLDWYLNESWQLSIGGRYTRDEKTESQRATVQQELYALALGNTPFGPVPFAIAPGMESVAAGSESFIQWLTPYTESISIEFPEDTDANDTWTEFSPSARVTWFAGDDLMFYLGYSSGFKSGGFQRTGGVVTPFDPETVDTYSMGMKSTWLDGSLRLNGELFFNDYQDKQLATIALVDGELAETVGNVGELETSGVELELTWLPPVNGLALGLNVGYLDTDVKSYETAGGDIADTTAIGFSPEWTAQGRVSYDIELGDAGSLLLGTDVSYRTESFTNSPIDLTSPAALVQVQEEHAIWNALVSWRSANQNWRVALEGKNLEDKRVLTNTFDLTVFQTGGWNMPRTWALSVGYEF